MYHGRFKNSHYKAGYHLGNMLYRNGKNIAQNPTFAITVAKKIFSER